MRRALRRELPAWSHFYGLKPWDIEQMTLGEIDEYRRQLREATTPAK